MRSQAVTPAPPDSRNQKVLQAARMYEQQFLGSMVKAMRQTIGESELQPASMGEKIYRDQLDQNYVEEWSNTGGVGFADMIYNHVMEKYMGQGPNLQRPKGPLPIQGTSSVNVKVEDEGQRTKIQIQRPQSNNSPSTLTAPWDSKATLVEGQNLKAYILDHGNGLKSTLAFDGTPVIQNGQLVKAGAKLALLNPQSQEISWNIERAS
jgi:peptidoglycan hydrolase FlgJ